MSVEINMAQVATLIAGVEMENVDDFRITKDQRVYKFASLDKEIDMDIIVDGCGGYSVVEESEFGSALNVISSGHLSEFPSALTNLE